MATTPRPQRSRIRTAPKVLLHDHLDGGLRPATLVDLARRHRVPLPTEDPDELARWISRRAQGSGLTGYLSVFATTLGVLQDLDALERVAAEAVEDFAADGVVYAEVRFAPELHQGATPDLDAVVTAVLRGLDTASDVEVGLILCAMRGGSEPERIVDLARRRREHGVVGVDIAGDEARVDLSSARGALIEARHHGLHITVHAGEAAGVTSIAEALDLGAQRLGHGVRIADEVTGPPGSRHLEAWGPVAQRVHTQRIPLEICPRSNLDTGMFDRLEDHPVDDLMRRGFAVTINTDNRLISATSLTDEFVALVETFSWSLADIESVTRTALDVAFVDAAERERIRREMLEPRWRAARTEGS